MVRWIIAFSLLVTAVSCQGDGCKSPAFINATGGTISSPYYEVYPLFTYPANVKCRWSISVPEGKNTRITFSTPMNVETSSGCSYDWVAIFEGDKSATEDICGRNSNSDRICGTNVPAPFVLRGNRVVVEFCTDASREEQGFQLTFNATDDTPSANTTTTPSLLTTTQRSTLVPIPSDCKYNITITEEDFENNSSNLYFESPNHPGTYPNNAKCTWNIVGPVGQGLSFTAETFDLESGLCDYDWLNFTDVTEGRTVALGKFCGRLGPKRLRSVHNQVRVDLVSDTSGGGTGFRIRIQKPKCAFGEGICPTNGEEENCFRPDTLCDVYCAEFSPAPKTSLSQCNSIASILGKPDCPGGADEICPLGCGIPTIKPVLNTNMTNKIVGGTVARAHSWPWQISLLRPDGAHRCGGSIIDHHWVVTAAHCCNPATAAYKIRVGEHDLEGSLEQNAWTYDLERVIMHPQYGTRPATHHDICLLKTVMPIFFNDHVLPVCLNSGADTPVGTNCFVTGWGTTAQRNHTWPNGSPPVFDDIKVAKEDEKSTPNLVSAAIEPLRQVDLKITSHETCYTAYRGLITEDMLCGYNLGKDSCQGDSGGPFVCPSQWDPNTFELSGVVSWGYGCGSEGIPGVYARTSYFLEWISETIMNN